MSQETTIDDIYKLFEKTNEKFEQSQQEWEKSRQEYDKRFQESKQEADRRLAQMQKAVDSLTARWGRFIEELVEPAVIKLFRSRGIDVKETYSRARVKRQGVAMEIDILVVDETDVVLVS